MSPHCLLACIERKAVNPSHRILLCANYVSILITLCNDFCEKSYLQRRKHPTWFKDLPFGLAQLSIPMSFCFFSLLIQLLHILFFASFFPCHFPVISSSPLIIFWLISTFLFIILPMYKMKDRKGKEYTSTKLLSHIVREEECWRSNNFHFATQWIQFLALSLLLTHIISCLSPFTKSVSSPFLRLFFHSFCIFSQPWR